VVTILASAYGVSGGEENPRRGFSTSVYVLTAANQSQVSFWIVPGIAIISTQVATQLGDPTAGAWFTSLYTICNAIAFMICGANSDLFGRRWFLIMGNVLLFVGHLMGGLAKNGTTMIAGFAIIGFGAGNSQLAAFALPELLPNKWRHVR
jgi:MFS family permease